MGICLAVQYQAMSCEHYISALSAFCLRKTVNLLCWTGYVFSKNGQGKELLRQIWPVAVSADQPEAELKTSRLELKTTGSRPELRVLIRCSPVVYKCNHSRYSKQAQMNYENVFLVCLDYCFPSILFCFFLSLQRCSYNIISFITSNFQLFYHYHYFICFSCVQASHIDIPMKLCQNA